MSLKLKDTDLNELTLNDTFSLKSFSWKKRSRTAEPAFSHGGRDMADGMLRVRVLQVEGLVQGANQAAYEAAHFELTSWLYKEDLQLSYDPSNYIKVKRISSFKHTFVEGGFLRIAKVSFTCVCEDPFWYESALSSDTQTVVSSPWAFILANSGSVETYPIFTITAAAINVDMTLSNTTDDNRKFRYQDTGFYIGSVVVIDCAEGTVTRDGTNLISAFDGSFLPLLKGSNSLEYVGANVTILTEYREREL